MRDATPKDEHPDAERLAAPTPQQRAGQIRAAAAEVRTRVQEWRDSPHWRDTDDNRHRYQVTIESCAALDGLPCRGTHDDVDAMIEIARALVAIWGFSRPGPEQAVHAAVERLRRQTRRR